MDEKGFAFTLDAVLMLIPIMIVAATVAGMSLNVPHESPYYQNQDIMETLYNIGTNSSDPSLASIANNITAGNIATAKTTAANSKFKIILDKNARNYNLTYNNTLTGNFEEIISKGNMNTATNVASSTRNYNGVTFRLFTW